MIFKIYENYNFQPNELLASKIKRAVLLRFA